MSCHVIWCDVNACVVSCHLMQCEVMVKSCWFEVFLWQCGGPKELLCTTKYYSNTTPVLLQYYSSTTKYSKVLLQLYSVLQSTTPVVLSTTKYYRLLQYYSVLQSTTDYSRTTLYYKVLLCTTPCYKVLLQYPSVLQSASPVPLCTTKYYSSTLLYYKVLQCTSPVLLCTTKYQYYSVLQSTPKYYSSSTLYYKVLLQYYSSTTLCYKVYSDILLRYYSSILWCTTLYYSSTTPVLLCPTKYYSSTTLLHCTTEVLLCTTKYYKVLLQYYSVLHSTTPVLLCTAKYYSSSALYCSSTTPVQIAAKCYLTTPYYKIQLQYYSVLRRSTHDWSLTHMERLLKYVEQQDSSSNLTEYCACHVKWLSWLILLAFETSLTLRGATGITLQPHQILHLPSKQTRMIDSRHIWNIIYNARSNRQYHQTSPNTAPATKNCTHDWSASHMKYHLQCAEQQESPSNLNKYCACHAKWLSWLILLTYETSCAISGATGITLQPHQIVCLPRKMTFQNMKKIYWKRIKHLYNAGPIQEWSDHDPSMIREWTGHLAPARSPKLLFALWRRILYWKLQHFALRLSTQISSNIVPATKSHTPTSPNAAPATKSHTPTSPNAAPATKSHSNITKCCACHEKWHCNITKCCACREKWHSNVTKYCTCHAK